MFSEVGLQLSAGLPENKWLDIGKQLRYLEGGHQWWIGDWANYGEREYGDLKRAADAAGFDYGTVREYARIARRFQLSIRIDNLSFGHHQVVAALSDDAAFRLLNEAEANRLSVERVRMLVHREQNAVGELPGSDTCSVDDLEKLIALGRTYGTVYADPPWPYGNQGTRAATGNHYGSMLGGLDAIAALPVARLAADNAHLHLWTTNAFLFQCPEIIKAWGFEYKSCFVWVKPQMGIGNYWRVSHEFLLFATRGSAAFRNHSARSWLEAKRGRHSRKPEAVRQLIESASPSPYLELFGRRNWTGWTVWGNEINRTLLDYDVVEL